MFRQKKSESDTPVDGDFASYVERLSGAGKGAPVVPPELQRKAIARMLAEWERESPGRIDSIFHAIGHVSVSQLADPRAFDFASLVRARSEVPVAEEGDPEARAAADDQTLEEWLGRATLSPD